MTSLRNSQKQKKTLPNKIEFKGKNPEKDQITNEKQKSEWINLKEIKTFHNKILDKDAKKGNTLKPNTKTYIRKKRYTMAFYVPKFTIYIHSNNGRIIEAKYLYHKEQEIIKFRNLEIWKLLDIKNTYYEGNEIIKFGNGLLNYNIKEVRRQKDWKIIKLAQGNRNRCNEKTLKKLVVLNYTERGKRQKFIMILYYIYPLIIYKIFYYTIYILYIYFIYKIFLHISQTLTYRLYLRKFFLYKT